MPIQMEKEHPAFYGFRNSRPHYNYAPPQPPRLLGPLWAPYSPLTPGVNPYHQPSTHEEKMDELLRNEAQKRASFMFPQISLSQQPPWKYSPLIPGTNPYEPSSPRFRGDYNQPTLPQPFQHRPSGLDAPLLSRQSSLTADEFDQAFRTAPIRSSAPPHPPMRSFQNLPLTFAPGEREQIENVLSRISNESNF